MSNRSGIATAAAATFVCIMSLGVWQFASSSLAIQGNDLPQSWRDFREGRTTGKLEKELEQKMPARPTLIAFANAVRYLLTNGAGEQVRMGNDQWLFLTEELRFDLDGINNLTARTNLIAKVKQHLENKHVKLVIALVPDKARVYANHLANKHYPAATASRYMNALTALRSRGVTVVDLLAPLTQAAQTQEVYYRSDTHWNQAGAKIAAIAIAQLINATELKFDKTEFKSTTSNKNTERPGDLIRLMGLENTPNTFRPSADTEYTITTGQTSSDSPAGLFGDSNTQITLTGTSYSLRGNFHGFLQEALSAKVLNAAKDGGGFLHASIQYLKDDSFKITPPKVLVWELPERFLQVAQDDEPNGKEQILHP